MKNTNAIMDINAQKLTKIDRTILKDIYKQAKAKLERENKHRAKIGLKPRRSIEITVPYTLLRIDYRYQREPDESRIYKILANWDPDKAAIIVCSARDDGMFIVDGQHTVLAGILAGEEEFRIKLLFNLTPEEEADYFATQQDNKKPINVLTKFRADLFNGKQYALDIMRICEERYITIKFPGATGTSGRNIDALGHILAIYKNYGCAGLEAGFDMLIEAEWDDYDYVFSNVYLSAMRYMCDTLKYKKEDYHGKTYKALTKIMKRYTPEEFLAKAKTECAIQKSKTNMHSDEKALNKYIKYLTGLITYESLSTTN